MQIPEELLEKVRPSSAFGAELARLPLDELVARANRSGEDDLRQALDESPLSLERAALLASGAGATVQETILARARALSDQEFGRSILLYAPCYLSSYCVNHCQYCGFNFRMMIPRRHLSPQEAREEVAFLVSHRIRRVLLVTGEYPAKVTADYLAQVIRQARCLAPELDLEVGPTRKETYRKWVEAGAEGVTCYQETYHPAPYAELHPRGPKTFYDFRLGTLERAGAAGMKRLGAGILLGLAEPLRDLLALIAHLRFLQTRFPTARLTASLPRLRPAVPEYQCRHPVAEETLLRFLAVLRLALPGVGLVVSTRERADLRRRLLHAGVTQMSAGSVTVPGGYGSGERDAGQFDVADHRSVEEVVSDLKQLGYTVRWTHATCP